MNAATDAERWMPELPICRWLIDQMKLDVMPTDETILGFSNRWYKPAIEAAELLELDGFQLRVVTTPYFIGTKLEAFHGRGRGDFYASSDLEDIMTVLDGRPTVSLDTLLIRNQHASKLSSYRIGSSSGHRSSFARPEE